MPRRSTARSVTIPPPTMGWNTVDPISVMDQSYALEAVNFFSNGQTVDLRNGFTYFAQNIGASSSNPACSFELTTTAGVRKLVSIGNSNGRPYDATAGGAAPTDLSSAGSFVMDANANGVVFRGRLFLKDRGVVHDVITWDGVAAAFSAAAFTGPGGDDKAVFAPQPYKSRLYFCGNDASIWYGGIDAVTGALTQFDVQSILTKGGKLLFVGGVQKTGDVNENLLALISERGEVLLYSGDYPAASNWQLVGRYDMPPPIKNCYRSFFYWGANLAIITHQGLVLLSEVIKGGTKLTFLTEKINDQFTSALNVSSPDYINAVYYAKGNMLVIGGREFGGGTRYQFVMNTITGSWWKWTIQGGNWCVWDDYLIFGAENGHKIYKADSGYYDEDFTTESTVQSRSIKLRPAYNYFGDRESTKQFVKAIPTMYQSEGMQLTMDADVDFANVAATQTVTANNADTAYKIYQPDVGLVGIGKCASIRIDQSVTTKRMSIQAIEVQYNTGDIT